MKRRLLMLGLVLGLSFGSICGSTSVQASDNVQAEQQETQDDSVQETENEVKDGLYTDENGDTYYYKQGVMFTGGYKLVTVNGESNRYYFQKDGKAFKGGLLTFTASNGSTVSAYFNKKGQALKNRFLGTVTGSTVGADGVITKNSVRTKHYYYFKKDGTAFNKGLLKVTDSNGNIFYAFFEENGQADVKQFVSAESISVVKSNGKISTKSLKQKSTYYMQADGKAATGWMTLNGISYYFQSNGALLQGKTNNVSSKSTRLNGLIVNKKGQLTTNGKKTTSIMSSLQKQINSNLKKAGLSSTATDDQKVDLLFHYLCNKCVYRHLSIDPYQTTTCTDTAYRMLSSGAGNCYCYGSAFAYLVAASTGYETRFCYGVCEIISGWGVGTYNHGWTEIKINGQWKIFDVELHDRGAMSFPSRYSTGKTLSEMLKAGTSYHRYGYVNITL